MSAIRSVSFSNKIIRQSSENSSSEILKIFEPLPQVLVTSPCSWHLQLNENTNRIPGNYMNLHFRFLWKHCSRWVENLCLLKILFDLETITEVVCLSPGRKCSSLPLFTCKQMRSLMKVAFRTIIPGPDNIMNITRLEESSISINTGCSCTTQIPRLFHNMIPGIEER